MAFTDNELANQMLACLVDTKVMTGDNFNTFKDDSTEVKVAATLTKQQLDLFAEYWRIMTAWIKDKGGNIAALTGLLATGRTGGNPSGVGARSVYNDAFNEVTKYIGNDKFSAVKAISNQLRFIKFFIEE